jgi:hypothetical protein
MTSKLDRWKEFLQNVMAVEDENAIEFALTLDKFECDDLAGVEELEENYGIKLSEVEIVLRLKADAKMKEKAKTFGTYHVECDYCGYKDTVQKWMHYCPKCQRLIKCWEEKSIREV